MKKDEIVVYFDGFVVSFQLLVCEGVMVGKLWCVGECWYFSVSDGVYMVDQVVVVVGGYYILVVLCVVECLLVDIVQIYFSQYFNLQLFFEGEVLVVGIGQFGCQIVEDLYLVGWCVYLGVGEVLCVVCIYCGKDVVEWLDKMKYYDLLVDQYLLGIGVCEKINYYVMGWDGGCDIDLCKFVLEGMQLYGKFDMLEGEVVCFGGGFKGYFDEVDVVFESIKDSIDKFIVVQQIEVLMEVCYVFVWQLFFEEVCMFDLCVWGILVVVWCIGFCIDFSWIVEFIFDGCGYFGYVCGVMVVLGLYFFGLFW